MLDGLPPSRGGLEGGSTRRLSASRELPSHGGPGYTDHLLEMARSNDVRCRTISVILAGVTIAPSVGYLLGRPVACRVRGDVEMATVLLKSYFRAHCSAS